ncbi:MAG: high-potential iron-sulfur protein [Alphaproteobacteria bacterium]|nr:high-potential iron-sulfur protein [Alphaproteobacteria bacterium]
MHTRREWIKWLVMLPAAIGLARRGMAETSGKVSQAAAKYQDSPKNGQMCGMCKFYIPPGGQAGAGMMGGGRGPGMMTQAGTCQIVEGSISPRGWCILYAAIGS